MSDRTCKLHGPNHFKPSGQGSNKRWRCQKCRVDKTKQGRNKLKREAVEYLGGCCSACGYDKCLNALEFHHINPDEKEFSISKSSSLTLDAIKSELDKCVLLCSNCHREVHNSD